MFHQTCWMDILGHSERTCILAHRAGIVDLPVPLSPPLESRLLPLPQLWAFSNIYLSNSTCFSFFFLLYLVTACRLPFSLVLSVPCSILCLGHLSGYPVLPSCLLTALTLFPSHLGPHTSCGTWHPLHHYWSSVAGGDSEWLPLKCRVGVYLDLCHLKLSCK